MADGRRALRRSEGQGSTEGLAERFSFDLIESRRELLLFCRSRKRRGRRMSPGDRVGNLVEIAGPDESLMTDRSIAMRIGAREFAFLQLRVCGHPLLCVAAR